MTELAKWAWLILLIILFVGPWIFAIIAFDIVVFLLVLWLKPEWLDKFRDIALDEDKSLYILAYFGILLYLCRIEIWNNCITACLSPCEATNPN